jgi:3-keto-5-aminohexanoate cleavage enzyme
MEDNIFYRKGRLLKNNTEEVEQIVRIIRDMNKEIATPAQAHQIMGISEKPSKY